MCKRLFAVAILLFIVGQARRAYAIAPQNQTINPTDDSVVRVLYNGGLGRGIGSLRGTGSVIDNMDINGQGVLCILTADHVVATGGRRTGATLPGIGFAFGNSPNNNGSSIYMPASQVARGGPTGKVDIAVFDVTYGKYNPAYDALAVNLVPATAFFNFTDIGYGAEGRLVEPMNNRPGGYQRQNSYGTQRYFNQKIGVFQTNFASPSGYQYEAAEWFVEYPKNPTAPAGSGSAFNGDSGSPLFTSAMAEDMINKINYFTDNEFAVATAVRVSPTGFERFGTRQFSVALNQADIAWIKAKCAPVPLPGGAAAALVLIALIAGGKVIARWQASLEEAGA